MQETQVQSLGEEDPLEKGMATHRFTLKLEITTLDYPDEEWTKINFKFEDILFAL